MKKEMKTKKKDVKKKISQLPVIQRNNLLGNFSAPLISPPRDLQQNVFEARAKKQLKYSRQKIKELKRRRRTGDLTIRR